MICEKCGSPTEEGAAFCTVCGARISDAAQSEKKQAAVSGVFASEPEERHDDTPAEHKAALDGAPAAEHTPTTEALPVNGAPTGSAPTNPAEKPVYDIPVPPMPTGGVVTNSPSYSVCRSAGDGYRNDMPYGMHPGMYPPPPVNKPKEFFGEGAFVFCLIVIALLAGTAGAFAYLYFSLLASL